MYHTLATSVRFMDHATYTNPTAVSTGIVHVVVNGRLALRDGVPTGMQAGQTLAHPTEGISRPAQLLMQTDTERPFVVVYDDHDPRQAGRMAVSVWLDGQYATRALPR